MKKMNELMQEMGFTKDAPNSTKEAFMKHLIKAATGVAYVTPSEKEVMQKSPEKIVKFPQQLSFDFESADLNNSDKKQNNDDGSKIA